jgi:hypothetical protein
LPLLSPSVSTSKTMATRELQIRRSTQKSKSMILSSPLLNFPFTAWKSAMGCCYWCSCFCCSCCYCGSLRLVGFLLSRVYWKCVEADDIGECSS